MKTRFKCRFINLVSPDGFWPYPYTLDQAFGVFAWMLRTGPHGGYLGRGILELLSGQPSCCNFSEVNPVVSVADLERRFHYAVLSQAATKKVAVWRDQFNVRVGGEKIIPCTHHAYGDGLMSEAAFKVRLDGLLAATGKLTTQLNPSHRGANNVYGVRVHFRAAVGYYFALSYGYGGSCWSNTLATGRPGETFTETFLRAEHTLKTFGWQPRKERS